MELFVANRTATPASEAQATSSGAPGTGSRPRYTTPSRSKITRRTRGKAAHGDRFIGAGYTETKVRRYLSPRERGSMMRGFCARCPRAASDRGPRDSCGRAHHRMVWRKHMRKQPSR